VLDHRNVTLNGHARGQSDQGFLRSGEQNSMPEDHYFNRDDPHADIPGNEAESIHDLRPQKKLLQTMGDFKTGLDASKINTTTENFIKNKHGVHITEKIHTTMNRTRRKKGEEPLQLGRQAYH
jgi:hypothetical protein